MTRANRRLKIENNVRQDQSRTEGRARFDLG
jgi:hypothetical protein